MTNTGQWAKPAVSRPARGDVHPLRRVDDIETVVNPLLPFLTAPPLDQIRPMLKEIDLA